MTLASQALGNTTEVLFMLDSLASLSQAEDADGA
jgi:hypothetical protein